MRWRGYLDKTLTQDGTAPDPIKRVLRVVKSNYTSHGGEIALRWHQGCYDVDEAPEATASGDPPMAQVRAERAFLDLLRAYIGQNRYGSTSAGKSHVP